MSRGINREASHSVAIMLFTVEQQTKPWMLERERDAAIPLNLSLHHFHASHEHTHVHNTHTERERERERESREWNTQTHTAMDQRVVMQRNVLSPFSLYIPVQQLFNPFSIHETKVYRIPHSYLFLLLPASCVNSAALYALASDIHVILHSSSLLCSLQTGISLFDLLPLSFPSSSHVTKFFKQMVLQHKTSY